ncbi:MAG: hypothetical protein JXR37_06760 [Kiritimatiellae bacterium]|nr:hypothetical protein [Kiritimatiellia bacterium]
MNRHVVCAACLGLAALQILPGRASGSEFSILGPDALSLGGAAVARATGAYARPITTRRGWACRRSGVRVPSFWA